MTEKILKTKAWLNRAFYADKKIQALDMICKQLQERAQGLSQVSDGIGSSGSHNNNTENSLMRLAEIEERIKVQAQETLKTIEEIEKAISRLEDDDLEAVLYHRYLLYHTIEQTAEQMHYSRETVKRKTNSAVEKLSLYVLE